MAESEKTEKTKIEVARKFLFPQSAEALNVLSDLYDESNNYEDLTNRQREIYERPMLFLAEKLCNEFGVMTNDLIKCIAVLNGLDHTVRDGDWNITIKENADEG